MPLTKLMCEVHLYAVFIKFCLSLATHNCSPSEICFAIIDTLPT